MRKKFCYLLTVLATILFTSVMGQQTAKTTSSGTKYLEYLPDGYNSNNNKYPVVISLHGIGERGTDVNKVANVSLAKYIKNGQKYPFIVISPQLKSSYGTWPPDYVISVLNYVKTKLRIDERRIYLTGLSLGGYGVWKTAGAYPSTFAAILPICSGGNDMSHACAIAGQKLPVWAFHGDADNTVSYTVSTRMVNAINGCTPKPSPLAKMTIFPGLRHVIWDKVYKETSALSWLTSFIKGSVTPVPDDNSAPATLTVSAGSDKSLTLPANSTTLQGSASGSTVSSYSWSKISGSSATLSGTTSSKLTASNLVSGSYTFRLTVKDTKGTSQYDDVKVTVNASTSNKVPIVNAGNDKSILTNYLTVVGSASDPDGYISSYQWTKISGPSASMSNVSTSKLFISKLTSGTYYFRLTVKDNLGASKYDEVKVVVKYSSTAFDDGNNATPAVSAGGDKWITLPRNYITLVGKASDTDGKITSYKWTKLSGGQASLDNETTPKLWANKLVAGTYKFRLTVKDDKGASQHDDMKLTVNYSTASLILKTSAERFEMMRRNGNLETPYRLFEAREELDKIALNGRRRLSELNIRLAWA